MNWRHWRWLSHLNIGFWISQGNVWLVYCWHKTAVQDVFILNILLFKVWINEGLIGCLVRILRRRNFFKFSKIFLKLDIVHISWDLISNIVYYIELKSLSFMRLWNLWIVIEERTIIGLMSDAVIVGIMMIRVMIVKFCRVLVVYCICAIYCSLRIFNTLRLINSYNIARILWANIQLMLSIWLRDWDPSLLFKDLSCSLLLRHNILIAVRHGIVYYKAWVSNVACCIHCIAWTFLSFKSFNPYLLIRLSLLFRA